MDTPQNSDDEKSFKEIDELKQKCFENLSAVIEKYKENDYILNRINTHINVFFSSTIDNEWKHFQERTERHNMLTIEQKNFIEIFLNTNRYYYLPNSESFYEYKFNEYTGYKSFEIISEDDILYSLLSEISSKRVLLDWKHKTKLSIMKLIKERKLFTCTPETETIQRILNLLFPLIFSTKDEAKYFLTIWGDNILKKQTNLIFLINNHTKKMMLDVDEYTNIFTGINNTSHNFMTKYHENHNYDNCRLLNSNQQYYSDIFKEQLKKYALDFICVAVHYSKRYENSDGYLEMNAYNNLKNYTYFLRDNKQEDIIEKFCSKYIQECSPESGCSISGKKIHYIWKIFLSSMNLPNIIYFNNLKNILKTKYQFDEVSDNFLNITTSYLPNVADFIKFWETNFVLINQNDMPIIDEFEIDEICSLFKSWKKTLNMSGGGMNEQEVLQLIKHFFNTVEIIDDKYITNIKCNIIDKKQEIIKSLEKMKLEYSIKNDETIISFDIAYTYYETYMKNNSSHSGYSIKLTVSKKYFENFLVNYLENFIIYDKFISNEWYKMMNDE